MTFEKYLSMHPELTPIKPEELRDFKVGDVLFEVTMYSGQKPIEERAVRLYGHRMVTGFTDGHIYCAGASMHGLARDYNYAFTPNNSIYENTRLFRINKIEQPD